MSSRITKEYRNEMVERVKKIAENSKEVIRHIRSKYVKVLNSYKDEESEDAIFEYTNKVRLGIFDANYILLGVNLLIFT